METVYILTQGFRHSSADVVGVFSSMGSAQQRQKEILDGTRKDLYPDFFRIDSIVLNVGSPKTEQCIRFDYYGNIIP